MSGGREAGIDSRLRIGFLHVGRERSGVRRYGRILAEAAATLPDIDVLEVDAGERDASHVDLWRAGRRLREVDVLHVQWKLADWGPRSGGLARSELLLRAAGVPAVVTLHDVFERHGPWQRRLSPSALGLRHLARRSARLVVHLEEERRRLRGLVPEERLSVVPHFVEQMSSLPGREAAKRALGLEGRRIITLLGYITRRKGHQLVLDTLPLLPDDVVALFVGSVIEGRDHVAEELRAGARSAGLAERVRFAGFVPDAELPLHLAATDVAVCPFRDISASGAFSTWIASGRPIVTSDLPAFREYRAMEPDALHIFGPTEPGPFAAAVMAVLEAPARHGIEPARGDLKERDPAVHRLAERLSTGRIIERYAAEYRRAAGR